MSRLNPSSWRAIPLFAGLVVIAGLALAGPPYQIGRSVVATGGGSSEGAVYRVKSTSGQLASGVAEGTQYRARTGFHAPGAEVATGVGPDLPGLPIRYDLEQNHPNPFNPVTTIAFSLPEAAHVRLVLHDTRGRRVRTLVDAPLAAGRHESVLDARDLSSGVYWYTLEAGTYAQTRRLVLVK